jgi:hypothetical protein
VIVTYDTETDQVKRLNIFTAAHQTWKIFAPSCTLKVLRGDSCWQAVHIDGTLVSQAELSDLLDDLEQLEQVWTG